MKQLAEKEKYFSKIISEFKTPTVAQINALKTILKTTKQRFSNDEVELIELTLYSCNYVHKLIDAFSRILAPKQEKLSLNYNKFNIVELLNEVIDELKILLKYNNLKIETICKKEVIISADKIKLKNVIENILSNAIKNASKDSTIQIKIENIERRVQFMVKNSNLCIEENALRKVFNKSKNDISLLGCSTTELGLYLSKEIINAHFGQMIIKCCEDSSYVLGFSLPL